jgi:hypothetical protein
MSELLECGHSAKIGKRGKAAPCKACYLRTYYAEKLAHPKNDLAPIGYSAAHKRVVAARGRAADQTCERCHEVPAREWAYCNCSPYETTGYRIMSVRGQDIRVFSRWSPRPEDYEPLCRGCRFQAGPGDEEGDLP